MPVRRAVVMGRILAPAIFLLSLGACKKWQPVSAPSSNGAQVMISYREPQDITVDRRDAESLILPGVRRLRGFVAGSVPDTLYIRIISVDQVAATPISFARNGIVAVTRGPDITVNERVTDGRKSLLAVVVTGAVLGALIAAIASDMDFGPTPY